MDESIHLPACNEVLSTCDVYHVINSTRLSHFFCSGLRRTWDEAIIIYDYTKTNKNGGGLGMRLDTGVQSKNCKGRVNSQTINLIGPYHTLDKRQEISYSGKLPTEKTFRIGKNTIFVKKTFVDLLALLHQRTHHIPKFL